MSLRVSLAVWLVVMTCANVAFNRWSAGSVVIGLAVTGALAIVAWCSRLGADDVGLARSASTAGLRWGAICIAIAAVGYAVALVIPAARSVVSNSAGTWPQTLLMALLVIPLGTVIPEELAFRGVLWGLLRRRSGRGFATAVSSALFGVWHVLPALAGGTANEALDAVAGGGVWGLWIRVVGTVVFTGAAGLLFCELRVRSGSLLAPIMAHWAVNGLGVIFVQLA